jgi:hypothetical protein
MALAVRSWRADHCTNSSSQRNGTRVLLGRSNPVRLRDRAEKSLPRSFQTNGTVIFESGSRSPQRLADEAVELLTPVCGYDDMVVAPPGRLAA